MAFAAVRTAQDFSRILKNGTHPRMGTGGSAFSSPPPTLCNYAYPVPLGGGASIDLSTFRGSRDHGHEVARHCQDAAGVPQPTSPCWRRCRISLSNIRMPLVPWCCLLVCVADPAQHCFAQGTAGELHGVGQAVAGDSAR